MRFCGKAKVVLPAAAIVLLALFALWPESAIAQCPLCRAGLEQGGGQTARTMNYAILVLLIPPVAIFCSIFGIAYRNIKKDKKDGE